VPNGPQRATQDVDVVSEESAEVVAASGIAADNLVRTKLAQRDPTSASTRLFFGDTKVEIIETMAVTPSEAADVEPERARLFVLAHRWALESATDCTITVVNTDVSETVPVASPAALVAMKLHSIQDRSDDRKRASDAWDIYRLLESRNRSGEISHAFAAGPDTLAELASTALGRVFATAVTQTRHWVVGFGEPEWRDILTPEALTELAEEFSDYLR
jgi:predicted nucleotidyltransferase